MRVFTENFGTIPPPPLRPADDDTRDLGFGAVVSRESRLRLLNRDGTFNVERRGLSWLTSLSAFHWLLTMTWTRFCVMTVGFYLATNAVFAVLYVACGSGALVSPANLSPGNPYARAFFFSVETLATIGYGHIYPANLAAHLLVTLESLFGLLGFALITGILFARFSRPTAKILFSKYAVVTPRGDDAALMFRIVNARRSELIELDVRVVMSRFEPLGGQRRRQYHMINLQRSDVAFFPLGLTVVHAIDATSPLFGVSPAEFEESDAELLVLIQAIDEGMSQPVHTRTSYTASEVVWGAKFLSLFDKADGAMLAIDVSRLDHIERVPWPERPLAGSSGVRS